MISSNEEDNDAAPFPSLLPFASSIRFVLRLKKYLSQRRGRNHTEQSNVYLPSLYRLNHGNLKTQFSAIKIIDEFCEFYKERGLKNSKHIATAQYKGRYES